MAAHGSLRRRDNVSDENHRQLARLKSAVHVFRAKDSANPSLSVTDQAKYLAQLSKSARLSAELHLKEGAQVLLLRNISLTSGLVNGSAGVVLGWRPAPDVPQKRGEQRDPAEDSILVS